MIPILEAHEIDLLEVFKQQEEVQRQYNAEAGVIQEKYAHILEAYKPAQEKLNAEIDAFKEEWDSQMSPYRKEMKALRKKYSRMLKAL